MMFKVGRPQCDTDKSNHSVALTFGSVPPWILMTGALVALFCLSASASGSASAGVLPMIVDRSSEDAGFWWSDASAEPAGELDRYFFERASSDRALCDPRDRRELREMSRVMRRADLTVNNARNIASIAGCERVLIGSFERDDSATSIPWLNLRRRAFTLRIRLVDVARGSVLQQHELRGVGLGSTDGEAEQAATAIVLHEMERALVLDSRDSVEPTGLGDAEALVFLSGGSAAAYVSARSALGSVLPELEDSTEIWATEGRLALALTHPESLSWSEIAQRLLSLEGRSLGDASVERVEVLGSLIFIVVGDPARGEERF